MDATHRLKIALIAEEMLESISNESDNDDDTIWIANTATHGRK